VGETALITGASSGIGEEFAKQLAARGHDLVLVARREDRLRALAESLGTTAHVVTCDLINNAAKLKRKVDKLGVEVDLLVNNAGFGLRGRFWTRPRDATSRWSGQLRGRCGPHPRLPPRDDRARARQVITVASTAGMQPLPYEATYGATKAFALNFTEALHMELRGTGVRALAVNPGPVPTEWQRVARYEEMGGEMMPGAIEADQVVREALRSYDRDHRSMVPGRFFRNFMRVNNMTPRGSRPGRRAHVPAQGLITDGRRSRLLLDPGPRRRTGEALLRRSARMGVRSRRPPRRTPGHEHRAAWRHCRRLRGLPPQVCFGR
jgi:short-subunit dehydrogenase